MEQRFRRQALYDLVWAEPLVTLAPKLGITGTALAKICRRHAIPVPGRGHWAKLKADKASPRFPLPPRGLRSEEHTSELQSLMRISYAVFCLKKKKYISHNVEGRTRGYHTH